MSGEIKVVTALDNTPIVTIPKISEAETFAKLEQAFSAYNNRGEWLKHHQKIDILNKVADLVAQNAEEFALNIAKEGGKPLVDAKVEVARAIMGIKQAVKDLSHTFTGQEIPMGFTPASDNRMAFTTREPIGVVFAISAFNHPLNLIVHQIVPAIAVGCPVLVKPASKTPMSCINFVELLYKAGLPRNLCSVVLCDNTVAEKIVADERVAFFSFIGSAQVGWYLRNKLANGTRYALEHGGVAAVVVDKDVVNMQEVVKSCVKGGYYHAGQVCISIQRIFVHNSVYNQFVEEFVEEVKKLKVGDPTDIKTEVGPLISEGELNRVDQWVKEAVQEGATLACGGKPITSKLYEATVLLNPSADSKVSKHEVFGPVVAIYSYSNLQDAVKQVNSVNMPFQSAVFSSNISTISYAYKNIDAAAVVVNDSTTFRVDWMPFAGRRSAGYGIGGIEHTMHEMTQHKMIVIKDNAL